MRILTGDCRDVLKTLPDESVHCVVTSPPYFGLRDYGMGGQIGLETEPAVFIAELVAVFEDVRRVLRADGVAWVNMGDSYANDGKWGGHTGGKHVKALHCSPIGRNKRYTGLKPKDLIGVPWMLAFALRDAGWYLRQDIIWAKPNPMPESVRDRCTKSHEYIFLLAKSERYYFDAAAIAEEAVGPAGGNVRPNKSFEHDPEKHRTKAGLAAAQERARQAGGYETRNKRTVWTVTTKPFDEAHFATFPPDLIEPCILAGCPAGGTVLDPFGGAGTTGLVADRHGRDAILIELNPEYAAMTERRIRGDSPLFAEVESA